MAEVADMKLDRMDGKRISIFSELNWMEDSFKSMAGKLHALWNKEQARIDKFQNERQARILSQIKDAVDVASSLTHPMVLCNANYFCKMGGLISYEKLRDSGMLVV